MKAKVLQAIRGIREPPFQRRCLPQQRLSKAAPNAQRPQRIPPRQPQLPIRQRRLRLLQPQPGASTRTGTQRTSRKSFSSISQRKASTRRKHSCGSRLRRYKRPCRLASRIRNSRIPFTGLPRRHMNCCRDSFTRVWIFTRARWRGFSGRCLRTCLWI